MDLHRVAIPEIIVYVHQIWKVVTTRFGCDCIGKKDTIGKTIRPKRNGVCNVPEALATKTKKFTCKNAMKMIIRGSSLKISVVTERRKYEWPTKICVSKSFRNGMFAFVLAMHGKTNNIFMPALDRLEKIGSNYKATNTVVA